MLKKLLGVRKPAPLSHSSKAELEPESESASRLGLRVVHAGGKMECYYMPIPAARIMDKYPSFVVARPDVFRRPWDSVIRPEEILYPGQKVLLVPRHTVRKLRWRFREAGSRSSLADDASTAKKKAERGKAEINESSCEESNSGYRATSGNNGDCTSRRKQVRFSGIDEMKKGKNTIDGGIRCTKETQKDKRRVRKSVTWEPSLTSITETLGNSVHEPCTTH